VALLPAAKRRECEAGVFQSASPWIKRIGVLVRAISRTGETSRKSKWRNNRAYNIPFATINLAVTVASAGGTRSMRHAIFRDLPKIGIRTFGHDGVEGGLDRCCLYEN
jgi:hypothetical protein